MTDTENSIWEVQAIFRYQSDIKNVGVVVVPIGFRTNLESVPRIPFIFDSLGDQGNKASTIHDWLYATGQFTRSVSDNVLLEALGVIGMDYWKRYLIWFGVRVGGWVAWDHHREIVRP